MIEEEFNLDKLSDITTTSKNTLEGDKCPDCGSPDVFGHMELYLDEKSAGIRLIVDCIFCGYGDTHILKFD